MFNPAELAIASGFQNNCGLNCIVHAFCDHIVPQLHPDYAWIPEGFVDDKGVRVGSRRLPVGASELLHAFNNYYGLNESGEKTLDWPELFKIIKDTKNPVHREILLGPVFRTMLKKADKSKHNVFLEDAELIELANQLNIKLESFSYDDDARNRLVDDDQDLTPGCPSYTLQLKHNRSRNHWDYAEHDAALRNAHNATFDAEGIVEYDAAGVRKSLKKAFQNKADLKMDSNLSPVIAAHKLDFEPGSRFLPSSALGATFTSERPSASAESAKAGTGSLFGDAMAGMDPKFAKVFEGVEKIIGTLFGSSTSNPTVKGFINVLVNLFKGLMLFKALLPELGKIFNPDGAADAKGFTTEQLRNPLWARYDSALQKLSAKNAKMADALRQEWLSDEKGRQMSNWMNLAQALSDAGLVTDANLILKDCEGAALDSFTKGKGKEGSGAAGSVGKGEKVDDLYREDLEELQDPDLDYASKAYKRENIQVRLQLLDNYYKGRAKIEENLILAKKADGSAGTDKEEAALIRADEERAKLDGALHSLFDGHKKRLDREREIAKAKIAARRKGGPSPAGDDSLGALT